MSKTNPGKNPPGPRRSSQGPRRGSRQVPSTPQGPAQGKRRSGDRQHRLPGQQDHSRQGREKRRDSQYCGGGAFGSPGGADHHSSEVANTSTNVVSEDFGVGTAGTQAVMSGNSAATDSFISSTQKEAEDFKKKAPALYDQFQTALSNYRQADTRAASNMAAGDINGILSAAPKDLEPSTRALRSKVEAMFRKTEQRWDAQDAARNLVLPDADKLRKLARESGITDPKALKEYLSNMVYHHHASEALSNQAGGRDIAETLLKKRALEAVKDIKPS